METGLREQGYRRTALEIARLAVQSGGRLRLMVTSDSMRPCLRAGDAVIVQPAPPESLRRGDLVVATREGDVVTHRLIAVDDLGWHLKGDALRDPDPALPAAALVGRVVAVERDGQTLDLQDRRWAIANRVAGSLAWAEIRLARAASRWPARFGAESRPGSKAKRLLTAPPRVLARLILAIALRRSQLRVGGAGGRADLPGGGVSPQIHPPSFIREDERRRS